MNPSITHLTPSSPRTGEGREFRPLNPYQKETVRKDGIAYASSPMENKRWQQFNQQYGHLLFHCTNPPDNDDHIELGRCDTWGWQYLNGNGDDIKYEWLNCTESFAKAIGEFGVRQSFRIKDQAEQKVTVQMESEIGTNVLCDDYTAFKLISATDKAPVSVEEAYIEATNLYHCYPIPNNNYTYEAMRLAFVNGANWEQQRIIGVIEAIEQILSISSFEVIHEIASSALENYKKR